MYSWRRLRHRGILGLHDLQQHQKAKEVRTYAESLYQSAQETHFFTETAQDVSCCKSNIHVPFTNVWKLFQFELEQLTSIFPKSRQIQENINRPKVYNKNKNSLSTGICLPFPVKLFLTLTNKPFQKNPQYFLMCTISFIEYDFSNVL